MEADNGRSHDRVCDAAGMLGRELKAGRKGGADGHLPSYVRHFCESLLAHHALMGSAGWIAFRPDGILLGLVSVSKPLAEEMEAAVSLCSLAFPKSVAGRHFANAARFDFVHQGMLAQEYGARLLGLAERREEAFAALLAHHSAAAGAPRRRGLAAAAKAKVGLAGILSDIEHACRDVSNFMSAPPKQELNRIIENVLRADDWTGGRDIGDAAAERSCFALLEELDANRFDARALAMLRESVREARIKTASSFSFC